mmetsp:Transcript_31378/g.47989  ORF Transcript_31378/g.47989 Transcript_31378/m.47989 type:complete len:121 (+) Transcript_31378:228-590(+)|eukprot:CAMPEP_0170507218 /NCGR_PEP_ID=MMETSP0208-20121228/58071_1 /TAXON_ID=197538 /ORGANISM="Strombidium inclinatum, Strain S3" /LENGTH=120 /DNA_ID=CAMNT_0010789259 /DNA_START=640 /DNA_END=1002 /DNA_ORIENTATION=+
MADELGESIPSIDDFFGDGPAKVKEAAEPQAASKTDQQKKSLLMPNRMKRTSALDPKAFDQKLVDRALSLLLDYQNIYQFSIVKCQARPFMKRSADLQEEVMAKGIHPDEVPEILNTQES